MLFWWGGVYVNPNGDSNASYREVAIDEKGRLPIVAFPSGATISATEENTLEPGIRVSITEQKVNVQNNSYFEDLTEINKDLYIYKISALMVDSKGKKTEVTTVEKPFTITLPNTQSDTGLCYVGVRYSDSDPWRFCRVTDMDDVTANMTVMRAAVSNIAPKQCTFKLHRLGISFVLVVYDGNNGQVLPETAVDSLAASSTYGIMVKDGKYLDDLEVKGIMKGIKVDSLNPSSFIARITYRNKKKAEASIKANGSTVTQTTTADKTVPGYTYSHSFEVANISDTSLMSQEGQFAFTLNLKDVETENFSSGLLIEFYNKIDSEKILPYAYSEFITVAKVESVTLAVTSDETNIADSEKKLYKWNPSFAISGGFNFSEADKEKIKNAISVSNIESTQVSKVWNGKVLVLSFLQDLQPSTKYTISMKEVKNLEGCTVKPFKDFSFTTVHQMCAYKVVHQQENVANNKFTVFETEELSAAEGSKVTPSVKTYTGFVSPSATTVTLSSNSENEVVYSYKRKVSTVKLQKGTGIASVSGGGKYKYGADVTASCTMLEGYVFDNWTGDETESSFKMPDTDVTMKANGLLAQYPITFNLDGGKQDDNPSGYNPASDTIVILEPVKEGYTFVGWIGSNGDTPQKEVSIKKGSTGAKTYTAVWTLDVYDIVYDLDGGSETANPATYTVISDEITLEQPTKEHYVFVGWTGSNGDTPQKEITIANGSIGNKSYKANWTNEVITYNLKNGVKLELVYRPPGTFMMGSPETEVGRAKNEELPLLAKSVRLETNSSSDIETQHQVTITKGFYIGKFEVTQEQYYSVVGENPSRFQDGNKPVEMVNLDDAEYFCSQLNTKLEWQLPENYYFMLPTEAQWEYACRAGTTTSLNNGTNVQNVDVADPNLDVVGWYRENSKSSIGFTSNVVGQKVPNAWGIYDMHGNVYELCVDNYQEFTNEAVVDPICDYGNMYVMRGGSFDEFSQHCRSANRRQVRPNQRKEFIGFRVVLGYSYYNGSAFQNKR